MKLISMTDYVLEQKRPTASADLHEADYYYQEYKVLENICNYANFLKQPLELWMFVPCDENGNVLKEPKNYDLWCKFGDFTQYGTSLTLKCKQYQQAKERVLFEGFEIYEHKKKSMIKGNIVYEWRDKHTISYIGDTIEFLTLSNNDFILTPNALKQIGL